jgi:hypothetical protein
MKSSRNVSGTKFVHLCGATILSRRIFKEVKAKLIAHFGNDRIRDQSKAVLNPI